MFDSYTYILASKRCGTLYIGVTQDLIRRVWEHKNKINADAFTAKYHVDNLVYYEIHSCYVDAARREKRLKNWPHQWKINLIQQNNPHWVDLYDEIC